MEREVATPLEGWLRMLTAIPAPAGFEDAMIAAVRREVEDLGYTAEVDPLGNVLVSLAARQEAPGPIVLLVAHTDEIGLIVRKVEDDGFLRCERLDGIPERVLPGLAMVIGAANGGLVDAVVGVKAHHLTEADEKYRVVTVADLYLDAGFRDRAAALAAGVRPGCPVVYARRFMQRGSRVFSPALDNRAACAILLDVAALLRGQALSCRPWLVFSVQEEFSLRGVLPAARRIAPDIAIAVDVAVSCDTPDLRRTEVCLGGGPALGTYSFHGRGTLAGVIPPPKLLGLMESVARAHEIPIQHNVFFGGLTDGSFLQFENNGIPTIEIGFPTRYTHAPLESCDLTDLQAVSHLLLAFLRTLPEQVDLARG